MRVILFTGKGGVGKTSIAAATACGLAAKGKKVCIMSTDQAHSLGDALDCSLTGEITTVTENLDALEVDTVKEGEEAWGRLHGYMKELLTTHANEGLETEELLVFPGLEELFSMFKILDIYQSKVYDALIVDCAPTGETLSLLKFPQQFANVMETYLPIKRKAAKVMGPAVEKVMKVPMPKEGVFDDLEVLTGKLGQLQELMSNQKEVSLRIVTTPEKIVIREAKHNFTCLQLFGYHVDAVMVNRIYPKQALEGYFHKWEDLQEKNLEEIKESFGQIPVYTLELLCRELRGVEMLTETAKKLYGDKDPLSVLAPASFMTLVRSEDGEYVLRLKLTFAEKENLELEQRGDELMIAVKNERRRLTLPDVLKGREVAGAKFEEGELTVVFNSERTFYWK